MEMRKRVHEDREISITVTGSPANNAPVRVGEITLIQAEQYRTLASAGFFIRDISNTPSFHLKIKCCVEMGQISAS